MARGYFGIGLANMKTEVNYGTLFRSANCFGADFIFMVGRRFKRQSSDTMRSERHIPLFEFSNWGAFFGSIPLSCQPIAIEITEDAKSLCEFSHPERAIYILGPEDGTLSDDVLRRCVVTLQIPTSHCLNLAVAGSIVMYDRISKSQAQHSSKNTGVKK